MHIKRASFLLVACALLWVSISSCAKKEEPPRTIGNELPYTDNVTKSLSEIIDSIPQASVYAAAFHRSSVQAYMDSLRMGVANAPYTLLVPSNDAMSAAGYTLEKVKTLPLPVIDTLVRYLSLPGTLTGYTPTYSGSTYYVPLMYPNGTLQRSVVPSPFSNYNPYYYLLAVAFRDNNMYLNGWQVSKQAAAVPATNGAVYLIDTVIRKPELELCQLIAADTSLSFYLAAMRKNNEVYSRQGELGDNYYNTVYNDTVVLTATTVLGIPQPTEAPVTTVFAPDNNAFRKAGFTSIEAINDYIEQSAAATGDPYNLLLTNMDSILVQHRVLYGYAVQYIPYKQGYNPLFTPDLRYSPSAQDNSELGGAIFFQVSNGNVVIHRKDKPNGRGAQVTAGSDINALNGVLHKVDNLLLPTP